MKINKEDIPVTMQAPCTIMRGLPGYGGMTMAFNQMPAGTDLASVSRDRVKYEFRPDLPIK